VLNTHLGHEHGCFWLIRQRHDNVDISWYRLRT
jgi:hypothetical protein